MIKRKSNYEIQAEKAKLEFPKWNHEKLAKKFNLEYDKDYLYIDFINQKYRLNRTNGNIEKICEDLSYIEAKHNEVMTILDLFGYSKDELQLSGNWINVVNLNKTVQVGSMPNAKNLFSPYADKFSNRIEDLKKSCEKLKGKKIDYGDVGYIINVFKFLPVMFIFYKSDGDFPAEIKILWDENILDYLHYETTYYADTYLFERIEELM